MALDDEIAEMQAVNKRLAAENIMLRAMSDAFDLIFGPADPVTDEERPDPAEDKDGGVVEDVKRTLRGEDLPRVVSPHS